ncbi:MAG: phage shock protein B, partial [Candidatus Azotimanducaceae bacterium]
MDGIVIAIFVPAVIFMVFVAPAWLFLHYRSKQQVASVLSETERADL